MGCEDKTLTKKEQIAQWKNRLLERLAQEKEKDPVNTYINADLSISSSNVSSEKTTTKIVPVPMKVRASLSKTKSLESH